MKIRRRHFFCVLGGWSLFLWTISPAPSLAKTKVCRGLQAEASKLLQSAVRFVVTPKRRYARCKSRTAGFKAIALYRAYLALPCKEKALAYYGLAVLSQACRRAVSTACRNYKKYLTRCPKQSSCRRFKPFRQKWVQKMLPIDAKSVGEDRDKDGFVSCYESRIICTKDAEIQVERGALSKKVKGRCDCNDENPNAKPGGREVCDGADNDCDGKTDEPSELAAPLCQRQKGVCQGARKHCGGKEGWLPCTPKHYQSHNKAFETKETKCDGMDNDCDGDIDNNLNPPPCTRQQGICKGTQKICEGKTGWRDCTIADYKKHNEMFESEESKCDGIDSDCDGKTDNNLIAPLCRRQKGACKGTRKVCLGQKGWRECKEKDYQKQRQKEYISNERGRCDGKDNDCDGSVDEGCMPAYPWILAGAGAAIAVTGGLIRFGAVQSPKTIAQLPLAQRPNASDVQNWVTTGEVSLWTGSAIAVAGIGLGMTFLIMSLTQGGDSPPPTPSNKNTRNALQCRPDSNSISSHAFCKAHKF